jgi:hypothetical protein
VSPLIRRWEEDNGRLLLLLLDDSNDDNDDGEDCRRPLAMVVALIIVRTIMVLVTVVCWSLRLCDGAATAAPKSVYGRFTYTIMSNLMSSPLKDGN